MTKKSSAAKKGLPNWFVMAAQSALRSSSGRPYFVLRAIDEDGKSVAIAIVEGTMTPDYERGVRFPAVPSHLLNHPKTAMIVAAPLQAASCGSMEVLMDEPREKTGAPTARLVSVK